MTRQPWLAAAFAVIMMATAVYCLTRLASAVRERRPTDRLVDAMHVLMGVAMAGMLVPRLRVVPAAGWEALFAAGAALFLWRMARPGHRPGHDVQHLLGCGAMVYMLAAMIGSAGGADAAAGIASGTVASGTVASGTVASGTVASGTVAGAMPAAGASGLGFVLAIALLGGVVWSADRISTLAPVTLLASTSTTTTTSATSRPGGLRPAARFSVPLSPRLAACCEIAMGITMGYMLIALR